MSVGCVRAIYKAWHKLSPKYRPDQPKKLMQILGDYHQYPIPDYLFNVNANELTKSVDGTFDIFMKAASDLAAALPASDGWHVLYGILEDRLPPGNDDGEMLRLLIETESFLKRFSAFPPLAVRRVKKGAPIKNSQLRIVVQLICWYVDQVEAKTIKSGFKDDTGAPTSRVARILEATLTGMGFNVPHSQIKTHLDAVKELQLSELSHWDLMSVLGGSRSP